MSKYAASPAFHPNGGQKVLDLHPALFAVQRIAPDGDTAVLCLHNVSDQTVTVDLPGGQFVDLLADMDGTGTAFVFTERVVLSRYQVLWLQRRAIL